MECAKYFASENLQTNYFRIERDPLQLNKKKEKFTPSFARNLGYEND